MYMYAHICAMPTVSGPPMRSHPVSSKKKPSFANYPACLMSAGSSLSSTSFSLGPRGSCTRLLLFAFVGDIGSERLLEETQQGACEPTTTKQLQQQQKQSGTGNNNWAVNKMRIFGTADKYSLSSAFCIISKTHRPFVAIQVMRIFGTAAMFKKR